MATTFEEIWALLRELAISQQETERKFQETDRKILEMSQKTDRELREYAQEAERRSQKTDRELRELGKQIGGLGQKFGSFTEGLALPSMEKILRNQFQMEIISPSVRVSKNGRNLELDVLAYANGIINTAYVVEVKSHLREEAIEQLKKILLEFRDFFPEHRDKKLYGILAAVDVKADLRQKVLNEGLYLARIRNEVFKLIVPKDFKPKEF